jgi:hypothetical protein
MCVGVKVDGFNGRARGAASICTELSAGVRLPAIILKPLVACVLF